MKEKERAEEKATVEEKQAAAIENEQEESTGRVTRRLLPTMPTRLVAKLWIRAKERRGNARERESEEKATVEEAQEEAKEKEQAEITERFTRRLLPTMSTRLATKLWVSGRKKRKRKSLGECLQGCSLLCPDTQ
jgi:hypothetical protein